MDEYPRWDARGLHHPFILQQMFIHATKCGQKEAERLIHHGHQQGLPKLDSKADVSAVQLIGYQMSSKEIRDLYHQVYALKRLPGPPPCGPERAQEIMKDIVSSLKDHLRWRKGEQPGGGGDWSLPALIPLALATKLHREESRTLQGSKNLLRPGKPTGRCWQLLPHWRNALKDSAGPPLGHGQTSATTPRVGTNQEEDLGDRAADAVGPHQGKVTNLSPLH